MTPLDRVVTIFVVYRCRRYKRRPCDPEKTLCGGVAKGGIERFRAQLRHMNEGRPYCAYVESFTRAVAMSVSTSTFS